MEHKSFYRIFRDEALPFGWKIAKERFFFFLQIIIIMAVVSMIPNFINIALGNPWDAPNAGGIISAILSLILSFGMLKIFIHIARDQKTDLSQLWDHKWIRFLRWILAQLIKSVLVMIGFVLLIIPGFFVAARLMFVEYFVVEHNMNSIEAISASWEVTKGHVWEIIGVWLICFGIAILGTLALFVGLLWAIPTIQAALARLYAKISSHLPAHTHASA